MANWKKWQVFVLAVVLACGALYAYRTALVWQLRHAVLAELTDPDSARFSNERLYSNWTPSGSALCGTVNSKNRMGGYVGGMEFTAFPGVALIRGREDAESQRAAGMQSCDFDKVAPWWHLRW